MEKGLFSPKSRYLNIMNVQKKIQTKILILYVNVYFTFYIIIIISKQ